MRYSTQQDVLDFVEDNNVKFVRFAFCDIFGTQKNIAVLANDLPKALEDGVCFDGSSIAGFMKVEESDLVLRPDLPTVTILPWRPTEGRVMQFFCDVEKPDGAAFGGNCRGFLRSVNRKFKKLGITCNVGAECEFYLFENDDRGRPTRIPIDFGGYFDVAPLDAGENLRRDICLTMEQMGMSPQHSHHESGNGQNEIDCHHAGPLKTADNVMMFKQIVRAIATRSGIHASFLPKPLPDQAGSGLHINLSLCMDGRNLFEGDIAPDSIAGSFMAGVLAHSRELTVFTNPLPNSYQRFGCDEAPRYVSWSRQNRSQLVRIPQVRGDNCRMELRSPDPACNPYLAIGLVLAWVVAGLFGVLIGIPALRLTGDYLAILTLGFGEIIRITLNNIDDVLGFKLFYGSKGLKNIPKYSNFTNVFLCVVITCFLIHAMMKSRHGRAVLAIRDNEIAAESCGIQTTYYKVMAFAFSAAFAGLAGGLYACYLGVLDPSTFGFMKSIEILVMVVLGGMGSMLGSILSATVLTILPEATRSFDSYRMVIYSLVLILMMIFRPGGLLGSYDFSMSRVVEKIMNGELFKKNKEKEGADHE